MSIKVTAAIVLQNLSLFISLTGADFFVVVSVGSLTSPTLYKRSQISISDKFLLLLCSNQMHDLNNRYLQLWPGENFIEVVIASFLAQQMWKTALYVVFGSVFLRKKNR